MSAAQRSAVARVGAGTLMAALMLTAFYGRHAGALGVALVALAAVPATAFVLCTADAASIAIARLPRPPACALGAAYGVATLLVSAFCVGVLQPPREAVVLAGLVLAHGWVVAVVLGAGFAGRMRGDS